MNHSALYLDAKRFERLREALVHCTDHQQILIRADYPLHFPLRTGVASTLTLGGTFKIVFPFYISQLLRYISAFVALLFHLVPSLGV